MVLASRAVYVNEPSSSLRLVSVGARVFGSFLNGPAHSARSTKAGLVKGGSA